MSYNTTRSSFENRLYQHRGTAVIGTWGWEEDKRQILYGTLTAEKAGYYTNISQEDGDEYIWDESFLANGLYGLKLVYTSMDVGGIAEVLYGNEILTAIDMYSSIDLYNNIFRIPFTNNEYKFEKFRLRVNGKNDLSFGYKICFSIFSIKSVYICT